MIKNSILFLSLFLFIGCEYTDFTEIQTDTSKNIESGVTAKSSAVKSTVPMLAVLINYNNIQISSSDTVWHNKLFGKNEHQLNHYYGQTSNNNFQYIEVVENSNVENDGIVSVHLDKNHPDIDVDSYNFELKTYGDFKIALELLDNFVDFSNYDNDANGHITPNELIVTFIMAGYEDAYEGRHVTNGMWGHQSCLQTTTGVPTLDGVTLLSCDNKGNFAIFGEQHDVENPHDATIGIIAHELGHSTFNLPDLYNTYNPNKGGIGYFGIMGSGTWATKDDDEYAGDTPTHFSAWSKIYNNWIEPIEIRDSSFSLKESASLDYNILKIPITSTSYYLLENRNNSGYDRSLASLDGIFNGGIAIWKIDETKLTQLHINDNTVNTDTRNKGVDLVEAKNGYIDSRGEGGDEDALYYEGNVNSFSTFITNISQRGSSMTLNIK